MTWRRFSVLLQHLPAEAMTIALAGKETKKQDIPVAERPQQLANFLGI